MKVFDDDDESERERERERIPINHVNRILIKSERGKHCEAK